jgi:hypothetical protein
MAPSVDYPAQKIKEYPGKWSGLADAFAHKN